MLLSLRCILFFVLFIGDGIGLGNRTAESYSNSTIMPNGNHSQSFINKMCYRVANVQHEHSLPEAIMWFCFAVISFSLNALAAWYFVFVKTRNPLQDILNANLFILHLVFGSTVQINVGIIYLKDQCLSRAVGTIGALFMTMSSLVTLILIACRQLKKFTRVGAITLAEEVTNRKKFLAIGFVWICCLLALAMKLYNPSTYAPIVIIFILSLLLFALYMATSRALRNARHQILASPSSEEKDNKLSSVASCDEALRILFALQMSTLITWVPASFITLLNRMGVTDSVIMTSVAEMCIKILFLPPILDPLSLFWSSVRFRRRLKDSLLAFFSNIFA